AGLSTSGAVRNEDWIICGFQRRLGRPNRPGWQKPPKHGWSAEATARASVSRRSTGVSQQREAARPGSAIARGRSAISRGCSAGGVEVLGPAGAAVLEGHRDGAGLGELGQVPLRRGPGGTDGLGDLEGRHRPTSLLECAEDPARRRRPGLARARPADGRGGMEIAQLAFEVGLTELLPLPVAEEPGIAAQEGLQHLGGEGFDDVGQRPGPQRGAHDLRIGHRREHDGIDIGLTDEVDAGALGQHIVDEEEVDVLFGDDLPRRGEVPDGFERREPGHLVDVAAVDLSDEEVVIEHENIDHHLSSDCCESLCGGISPCAGESPCTGISPCAGVSPCGGVSSRASGRRMPKLAPPSSGSWPSMSHTPPPSLSATRRLSARPMPRPSPSPVPVPGVSPAPASRAEAAAAVATPPAQLLSSTSPSMPAPVSVTTAWSSGPELSSCTSTRLPSSGGRRAATAARTALSMRLPRMSVTDSGSRTVPMVSESGVTARLTPASAAVVPFASKTARR